MSVPLPLENPTAPSRRDLPRKLYGGPLDGHTVVMPIDFHYIALRSGEQGQWAVYKTEYFCCCPTPYMYFDGWTDEPEGEE